LVDPNISATRKVCLPLFVKSRNWYLGHKRAWHLSYLDLVALYEKAMKMYITDAHFNMVFISQCLADLFVSPVATKLRGRATAPSLKMIYHHPFRLPALPMGTPTHRLMAPDFRHLSPITVSIVNCRRRSWSRKGKQSCNVSHWATNK
jgi:hypothetical protein